ncbi:MAG: Ig-like domain-containing protein [Planctomycetota bacterium]|jgi:hypothetical protein
MTRTVWMIWIVALALAVGCEEPKPGENGEATDLTSDSTALAAEGADTTKSAVIGVEEGVLLVGYDCLTYPGQSTPVVARLARGSDLKPIGGVTISFYQDDVNFIGTAVTDDRGIAQIEILPTRVGDYRFTAQITEMASFHPQGWLTVSPAPLLVAARDPETPLALVDLDRTIAQSDFIQAVDEEAKPILDSRAVLTRLGSRYSLVYLVDHPQAMSRQAKRWLSDRSFPPAPLLLVGHDEQADDAETDTQRQVREIQGTFQQSELLITGNLPDAADPADGSPLTTFWLVQIEQDSQALRALADQMSDPWTVGQAQVVDEWRQIEVSVFHGVRGSPTQLAERLRRLADELESRP